jgi:hypothetical protein
MRTPPSVVAVLLLTTSACLADDAKSHLVSVQRYSPRFSIGLKIKARYATGICIDEKCSVVATVYHAQMGVGRANLGIVGGRTIRKVLSLANESDTNKADVPVLNETLTYDIAEDISFVYTRKPVSKKSGTPYSFEAFVGQEVQIAGFNKDGFGTTEAHIIGLDVPVLMGKARILESLILDVPAYPGMSGSAVLDDRGRLLGMITQRGLIRRTSGDVSVAIALPVRTIAAALRKLDPTLGRSVFGDIPADEKTISGQAPVWDQPEWYADDAPENAVPEIPTLPASRSETADAVARLRANAAAASKLISNMAARQCLTQSHGAQICLEVSATDDGQQMFQEVGRGGKFSKPKYSFPVLQHGTWITTDWADTLADVANNSWIFQGFADGHYLFTFRATAKDERCVYQEYWEGLGSIVGLLFGAEQGPAWEGPVECFQQVITDKDFNIVSIVVERRPPEPCRAQVERTLTFYDWVMLKGTESPILVPVKEIVTAKWPGYAVFYTKVVWTDYRKFRADSKYDGNFKLANTVQ